MPEPRQLDAAELVQLRATVARLWPEIARAQGIRCATGVMIDAGGMMHVGSWVAEGPTCRALEHLARALEDAGYAIARRGSARIVTGWVVLSTGRRIADIDAIDPVRAAYHTGLSLGRAYRDRLERGPVQLVGKDKMLAVARQRAAGGR